MRGVARVLAAVLCASLGCSEAAQPPPPVHLAPPARNGEPPPESLLALEANARSVDEALRTDQCPKAEARLRDARAAWAEAEPLVRAAGASPPLRSMVEAEIARLGEDVAACQPLAARADAIDLLQADSHLLSGYLGAVPPAVLRLDADLRRVRLDADAAEWSAATLDAGAASMTWARLLEAQVAAIEHMQPTDRDAASLQHDVPAALERVRAQVAVRDDAAVAAQVEAALEQVSALRQLFAQHGDVTP
jgi:hypothetical protein